MIIAILLPPLAVGIKAGIGFHLFLKSVLTLLLYLPGPLRAISVGSADLKRRRSLTRTLIYSAVFYPGVTS